MITQKELKDVLDYDEETGIFTWMVSRTNSINVGDIAGTKNKLGYIQINIGYKIYYAHRLAYLHIYGYMPKEVDHRDQIKWHNWKSNLRKSTRKNNSRNRGNQKNNKSGVKGVIWNKYAKKWNAYIKINSTRKHLGYFKDINQAVLARYLAERKAKWHLSDPNSLAQEYCIKNGLIKRPIWVTINKRPK